MRIHTIIKYGLFLALCLFIRLDATAEVAVKYRVSRTHGLVKFVMAISGESHLSPNIKESFERSRFKEDSAVTKALKKIESIQDDLHIGMEYAGLKANETRRSGMDVISFINIQSIFATSIDDLSERVLGTMPMAAHTAYFSALKELDPIYEELYWRPSSGSLYATQNKLESIAKKVKLNQMFKKAEKFYEASWPLDTPFVIGLYPILYLKNFRNSSTSQSLGSIEEHGVLVGTKDPGSFGVVFHELCHSLYGAQPPEVMEKWDRYFKDGKSPYRLQTQTWMNETLATVLGNGWAYKQENGHLEKDNWYNHPIIDPFSQALYPKIMEYLDADKSFDQNLADFMISKFAELFPDAIYDYSHLLNKVVVLHDNKILPYRELSRSLRKNFEISSLSSSTPLADPRTISTAKERAQDTLLLIFSNQSKADLKKLLAVVPDIGPQAKLLMNMKDRQIFSYLDTNSRAIIAIQASTSAQLHDAVTFMKNHKINPTKALTGF